MVPRLQAAAHQHGLYFIPLFEERYDLILPREQEKINPLLDYIQTADFRNSLSQLIGYNTTHSGEQIHCNAFRRHMKLILSIPFTCTSSKRLRACCNQVLLCSEAALKPQLKFQPRSPTQISFRSNHIHTRLRIAGCVIPLFEEKTGTRSRTVAVGTGQAFEDGRKKAMPML